MTRIFSDIATTKMKKGAILKVLENAGDKLNLGKIRYINCTEETQNQKEVNVFGGKFDHGSIPYFFLIECNIYCLFVCRFIDGPRSYIIHEYNTHL
jgi:hypothetical protein